MTQLMSTAFRTPLHIGIRTELLLLFIVVVTKLLFAHFNIRAGTCCKLNRIVALFSIGLKTSLDEILVSVAILCVHLIPATIHATGTAPKREKFKTITSFFYQFILGNGRHNKPNFCR